MVDSEARTRPGHPVLIYDGECEFCRRWVARFKRWEIGDSVEPMPLQDPRATELAGRTQAELEEAMCVVLPDGAVFTGADAVRALSQFTRGRRVGNIVFGLPGVEAVANRIYRWIARRRTRNGCGGDHCPLGRS